MDGWASAARGLAAAQLQRTRWQLAVAQARWPGPFGGVRAALVPGPVAAALWRCRRHEA